MGCGAAGKKNKFMPRGVDSDNVVYYKCLFQSMNHTYQKQRSLSIMLLTCSLIRKRFMLNIRYLFTEFDILLNLRRSLIMYIGTLHHLMYPKMKNNALSQLYN